MPRLFRRLTAAASVLLLSVAVGQAQPSSRAECETAYPASWGRAGKDVVWVPTSEAVVLAMLTMAQVTPQDLLIDLGAGDGRIAIAAAKTPFGARSVGIEYDPDLARRAGCLVQAEGVADKVRIVEGDSFKEDFSGRPTRTAGPQWGSSRRLRRERSPDAREDHEDHDRAHDDPPRAPRPAMPRHQEVGEG